MLKLTIVPVIPLAFPHREELFLLEHSVVVPASTPPRSKRARLAVGLVGARAPSGSSGVYANFPDPDLPDEHRAYWGGNLERVRQVKEKYDPEWVFG